MYQISVVSKNRLWIFLLETVFTPNWQKKTTNSCYVDVNLDVIFYVDMIQKHGVFCGVRLPPLIW